MLQAILRLWSSMSLFLKYDFPDNRACPTTEFYMHQTLHKDELNWRKLDMHIKKKVTPRLIVLIPFILKIILLTASVECCASSFLSSLQWTSHAISFRFPVTSGAHCEADCRSWVIWNSSSQQDSKGDESHISISLTQVSIN